MHQAQRVAQPVAPHFDEGVPEHEIILHQLAPGAQWTGDQFQTDRLMQLQWTSIKMVEAIQETGYLHQQRVVGYPDLIEAGKINQAAADRALRISNAIAAEWAAIAAIEPAPDWIADPDRGGAFKRERIEALGAMAIRTRTAADEDPAHDRLRALADCVDALLWWEDRHPSARWLADMTIAPPAQLSASELQHDHRYRPHEAAEDRRYHHPGDPLPPRHRRHAARQHEGKSLTGDRINASARPSISYSKARTMILCGSIAGPTRDPAELRPRQIGAVSRKRGT
jgi:hypothetical protein